MTDTNFEIMRNNECYYKILETECGSNFWIIHFECGHTLVYRESYPLAELESYMIFPNTMSYEDVVQIVQDNIDKGLFV